MPHRLTNNDPFFVRAAQAFNSWKKALEGVEEAGYSETDCALKAKLVSKNENGEKINGVSLGVSHKLLEVLREVNENMENDESDKCMIAALNPEIVFKADGFIEVWEESGLSCMNLIFKKAFEKIIADYSREKFERANCLATEKKIVKIITQDFPFCQRCTVHVKKNEEGFEAEIKCGVDKKIFSEMKRKGHRLAKVFNPQICLQGHNCAEIVDKLQKIIKKMKDDKVKVK